MNYNERPILFNADMVNALLAGRKTQTRRALSPANIRDIYIGSKLGECHPLDQLTEKDMGYVLSFCPFGQVGDLLYVRETFSIVGDPGKIPCPRRNLVYRADYPNCVSDHFDRDSIPPVQDVRFTPSIHMPKWASRIQLQITNVRLEKVVNISAQDAIAEGIEPVELESSWYAGSHTAYRDYESKGGITRNCPIDSFKTLWRSTGGKWDESVYVWAIDFKVVSTTGRLHQED